MTQEQKERQQALGWAVRDLRERRGLSQNQLEGVSPSYLSQLEQGKRNPTMSMLDAIADALEIPLTILIAARERRRVGQEQTQPMVARMLPGGIAEIAWKGPRLNITNNHEFIVQVFTWAKQHGAKKVLLNLFAPECDFSAEDHRQGERKSVAWLREQNYWPKVAVLKNPTLDGLGAELARDDGLSVRLFSSRAEALAWLEQDEKAVTSNFDDVLHLHGTALTRPAAPAGPKKPGH